jgi:hypothetical protein
MERRMKMAGANSNILARNNVKVLAGDGRVLLYAHGFG